MSYAYGTKGSPAVGRGLPGLPRRSVEGRTVPDAAFTTPGEYSVAVPAGVQSASFVIIQGGARGYAGSTGTSNNRGDGGAGGALGWLSALAVNPGDVLDIAVSAGGGGQVQDATDAMVFLNGVEIMALTGAGNIGNGKRIVDPQLARFGFGSIFLGGAGGSGRAFSGGGGGGSAGYMGNGGNGGAGRTSFGAEGLAGSGGIIGSGAAAGGASGTAVSSGSIWYRYSGRRGGGVGLYGLFPNDEAEIVTGVGTTGTTGLNQNGSVSAGEPYNQEFGGGGGGGGLSDQGLLSPGLGQDGAARILFGPQRLFPMLNVGLFR